MSFYNFVKKENNLNICRKGDRILILEFSLISLVSIVLFIFSILLLIILPLISKRFLKADEIIGSFAYYIYLAVFCIYTFYYLVRKSLIYFQDGLAFDKFMDLIYSSAFYQELATLATLLGLLHIFIENRKDAKAKKESKESQNHPPHEQQVPQDQQLLKQTDTLKLEIKMLKDPPDYQNYTHEKYFYDYLPDSFFFL